MRLAVVLETEIASGGGFNQALNAIVQAERLAPEGLALAVVRHKATLETLRPMVRAEVVCYRRRLGDWAMAALVRFDATGEFRRRVRLAGPFERFLIRRGIDLVYFVAPSSTALVLQRLNMITTVWDASHRDAPEFPEVRAFGEMRWRDYILHQTMPQSLAVLTDSQALADRLANRFGIDRERLIAMPFSAAPHLSPVEAESTIVAPPGNGTGYFYYPAQFWPHKNHVRVLEALRILRSQGIERDVVFSGYDMGGLDHVRSQARVLGVEDLVRFVGFVPAEEIAVLYSGAAAVVMPSYFGPTNLPPLEAWTMRLPLVCSDVMADQVGDAALVVNPDDAQELAAAMADALKPDVATRLISNGTRRLADLAAERSTAEAFFAKRLRQFARRRICWRDE